MRGCCGTVAAPNYYQTAANTQCERQRGPVVLPGQGTSPAVWGGHRRPRRAPRPPSVHSHTTRPPLQPIAPAASSTSPAEIAGWQGNRVCKYDRTDKQMSCSLFGWLGISGREARLPGSLHTVTADELWDTNGKCKIQTGAEGSALSDTKGYSSRSSSFSRKYEIS